PSRSSREDSACPARCLRASSLPRARPTRPACRRTRGEGAQRSPGDSGARPPGPESHRRGFEIWHRSDRRAGSTTPRPQLRHSGATRARGNGSADRRAVVVTNRADAGRVERVNGPLVEVSGLSGVAALDVIEVGPLRIPAEVVAIHEGRLTAEAFEYTGGLRVGDEATAQRRALSARLGPDLLGGIFDGLLRPLEGGPTWLEPGSLVTQPSTRSWPFVPTSLELGTHLESGTLIGTLTSESDVQHRVLVPPDLCGKLTWLSGAREVAESDPVATIDGRDVTLFEQWPVRRARPARARLRTDEPLV